MTKNKKAGSKKDAQGQENSKSKASKKSGDTNGVNQGSKSKSIPKSNNSSTMQSSTRLLQPSKSQKQPKAKVKASSTSSSLSCVGIFLGLFGFSIAVAVFGIYMSEDVQDLAGNIYGHHIEPVVLKARTLLKDYLDSQDAHDMPPSMDSVDEEKGEILKEKEERERREEEERERKEKERKTELERKRKVKEEAEKKAEQDRKEKERKEEKERKRKEKEEAEKKAERERKEKERKAEEERKKREKEEAERKAELERREKIRKEEEERKKKEEADAKRKAEEDRKEKERKEEEKKRKEKEAAERKEKEKKEEERKRKEKEEAERMAEEETKEKERKEEEKKRKTKEEAERKEKEKKEEERKRKAKEEEERKAEEERKRKEKEEAERKEKEKKEEERKRKEKEEAERKAEEERKEKERKEEERKRKEKEEEERKAEEERERKEKEEAERKAVEERREKERKEVERKRKEKEEAERKKEEERKEKERRKVEEMKRKENEEAAKKVEQEKKEKDRKEAAEREKTEKEERNTKAEEGKKLKETHMGKEEKPSSVAKDIPPQQIQEEADEPVPYEFASITNAKDFKIKDELDEADRLYDEDDYEGAIAKYDSILRHSHLSPRAMYGKGLTLDKLGFKHMSNEYLEQAINFLGRLLLLPDVPDELYLMAGRKLAERQHFRGWGSKAVKTFTLLLERFPEDIKLRCELGVTYMLIGRNEQARDVFEQVLQFDPNSGFAKAHIGFIFKTANDDLERAIPLLRDGIASGEEGTSDGRFYTHLGDALIRVGQEQEARHYFEEAEAKGLFLSRWQRSLYNVKELTGRPFWTAKQMGYEKYIEILEKNWKTIRDEGLAQLDEKTGSFVPEAENLRDTGEWKQFTLYQQGRKNRDNCAKVPKTCALIDQIPPAAGCKRGQVKFSVMSPGIHVWPHTGPTNCRLRSHLGLVVPDGPELRVVNETRMWKEGKVMTFDDSFEHEVWHRGTEWRLILIVDFWHPELTERQRRTLSPI